jgi:hypothetical protein
MSKLTQSKAEWYALIEELPIDEIERGAKTEHLVGTEQTYFCTGPYETKAEAKKKGQKVADKHTKKFMKAGGDIHEIPPSTAWPMKGKLGAIG